MNSDDDDELRADCLSEDTGCSSDSDEDLDSDTDRPGHQMRFSLEYSDSESDNNVEINGNVCSPTDKSIALEPFQGEPGIKVMPESVDSVGDIVNLFIGDDLFQHMVVESNRYRSQIGTVYKQSLKTNKWTDITVPEMKKFLGLILLMGQVKKDLLYDYWSTDPTIETPIFAKAMSRNRFMQILQSWHFSNNDNVTAESSKLVKVEPVISYFRKRFNEVYKPTQQLALDECIIPWQGKLSFKTYNPARIMKYGILVRQLCEAATGYICNFEIYTAETNKLEDAVAVIEPYINMWHHIYQDNYYSSTDFAQNLIKKKTRICGIIKTNRDLPKSLPAVQLSNGQVTFLRNQDALLQMWSNHRRSLNMISTIHSARLVDTMHRRSNRIIQKPESVLDYNKYMRGVDRADRHLSYFSIFRKTKKWAKRVVMFFIHCALFNSFKLHTLLSSKKKTYKKFLLEVAKQWIESCSAIKQEGSPDAESIPIGGSGIPGTSTTRSKTPRVDNPGRLSNMKVHKLVRIMINGRSRMPQRQCRVCASKHIRSRTCFICQFCKVPLHKGDCTERYHTLLKY